MIVLNSKNKITVENGIAQMELYDYNGNVKHCVMFDEKHVDNIKLYRWSSATDLYIYANFYDETNTKKRMVLHKFIMYLSGREIPDGHQVDHKDRNKLNCLNNNLRVCTRSQNNQNQKGRTGKTSKYKGVYYDKDARRWLATINIKENNKYKHINLGRYLTENEAAEAYNEAAIRLFGEFALPNIIE